MIKQISLVILFFLLCTIYGEAAPQWLDATHIFDKEVKLLVSQVKLETKAENAKRFKNPPPAKKEYKVGDVETFWTKNIVANKFEQIQATVKAIGKHCYVFLENGQSVPESAIQNIMKTFDEKIYPINTKVFGSEWKPGIDGDERITLLLLDIKDGYNGQGGFVAGYFFAGDEFLQSQIPPHIDVKSNEREMLYLDVNPADPTSDHYMSVVAHEFQHMIHFIHDPKEATWVNESCSQIAPFLCGFGHASQIISFLRTPDNSLTAWAKDQMLANYGQVYLWNYYILNKYLKNASSLIKFFNSLVDDPAQGHIGFENSLKQFDTTFENEFIKFCVTNFINDPAIGKGEYAYDESLRRLRIPPIANLKALPAQVKDKVYLWSADGIKVDISSAKQTLHVDFSGDVLTIDGKKSYFAVAGVLSDSRNKITPALYFMKLGINGATCTGKLTLTNTNYDTLTIIIICLGPKGIADSAYAKAGQFEYQVSISDEGEPVIARSLETTPSPLLTEYLNYAEALNIQDSIIRENALVFLESLSSDITKTVAREIENGSFETIDNILRMSLNSKNKIGLKPLAKKLAVQLQVHKLRLNNPSISIEEKIKALKEF